MLNPNVRRREHGFAQRPYRSYDRMDRFIYGNPRNPGYPSQPIQQNSLLSNLQQHMNPTQILGSPHISKGINGLSGVLDNVQQFLRIVETTTPLIREYGPMIKNLPAMYRMMKAIKEIDDDEEEDKKEIETKQHEPENKTDSSVVDNLNKKPVTKKTNAGLSTPKLFI